MFPNIPLMIPFVTSLAAVFTTVVVAFSTVVEFFHTCVRNSTDFHNHKKSVELFYFIDY